MSSVTVNVIWLQFIGYIGPPQEREVQDMRRNGKTGDYAAIGIFKEGGLLDIRTGGYICCGSD